jgi:hypothetical protein
MEIIPQWLSVNSGAINAVSSCITAAIAVAAAFGAWSQLKHMRAAHYQEMRPFCSVRYEGHPDARGEECIWIVITNFGRTPAIDVTITFSDESWHNANLTGKYPFLDGNGGISVLAPGETRKYFVARKASASKMSAALTNNLVAKINYKNLDSIKGAYKVESDVQRLSLLDYAGSKKII